MRILFIGLPNSSHTHSWIDLLEGENIDVRFFATTAGHPPENWWVKSYLFSLSRPRTGHPNSSQHLSLSPERQVFVKRPNAFSNQIAYLKKIRKIYNQYRLSRLISKIQPDLIHTLGIFDEQGGQFLLETLANFEPKFSGKWIVQARGGPDLDLNQHIAGPRKILQQVLARCDSFIADNARNYENALALGLAPHKISSLGPVPGTGGVDCDRLQKQSVFPVLKRERVILWPKAYEGVQSKALPVIEGIRLAWESIKPCSIIMTAISSEVQLRLNALPGEIRDHIVRKPRVPRDEMLEIMGRARVTLLPSLSDGVPNTLYEAMACGSVPILSPLPTFTDFIHEPENALYARNLYPVEIAAALIRAMQDDDLVQDVTARNLLFVRQLAERKMIRERVVSYYSALLQ
jgi:glycosyltransferase involved in cell wall biosynthesis